MKFKVNVSNIGVKINAILLHTDESILGVSIGNGYKVEKVQVNNEFAFFNNIVDGKGKLKVDYFGSKLVELEPNGDENIFLVRFFKDDLLSIEPPTLQSGINDLDSIFDFEEQIKGYYEKEFGFLNNAVTLFQLFKRGNIGIREVNARFKYTVLGVTTQNNINSSIHDANIVRPNKYSLNSNEIIDINKFVNKHIRADSFDRSRQITGGNYCVSKEFEMLTPISNKFTFGLKQIELSAGFEQFITAMEMLLLKKDERGKKEILSKRTASLLGSNNAEVINIYNNMRNYYSYRSESLHEGDGSNITMNKLGELENIVRESIKKYLIYCENEIMLKPNVTWEEIKSKKISDLKNLVVNYKSNGILP